MSGDNIIKKYRTTGFTQINNAMLDNPEMSLKSKALLAILLSCKDGWHFYMSDLVGRSTDGKDSLLSARRELEQLRYVICTTGRGNAGKFGGLAWHISDVPFSLDEYREITGEDFPRRLNRDGESSTNNTKLNNTNLNNTTNETAQNIPGETEIISSLPGDVLNEQTLAVAVAEFAQMHPPQFRAAPPSFVDEIAPVAREDAPVDAGPSTPITEAARGTSESAAERLARLRNDPNLGVLTAEREEKLKSTRRHYAGQAAIKDATLQAIFEFIPENFPLIKQLMKDTGMKPEKMLEYLRSKPNIIGPLKVLKKNDYPAMLETARTEASKHTDGWMQYAYIHLIDLAVKKVTSVSSTKAKKTEVMIRIEMRDRVGTAPTRDDALSIVNEYVQSGEAWAGLGRRSPEEYVTLIWEPK